MQPFYAPDFLVSVEGLTLEADVSHAVTDLTYDSSRETADMCQIQLDNAGLRFSDSPLFEVGKTLEVHLGYAGDLRPMMLGEIVAVNPSFPSSGAPTLSITAYDRSHRMRHNCPDRFTFKMMSDSLIAAQIAIENGLIPVVDPAPTMPSESLQQTESDWALLHKLAERNCFELYVHWDRLYFRFPRPQTERVTLEWGKHLLSFSPRLSTSGQVGLQVVRGYDPILAQTIVAAIPLLALDDLEGFVERLGSDVVNKIAGLGRRLTRGQRPKNSFDAKVIARAMLRWLLDGMYEGSGSCIGMPMLRAGDQIDIRGVGRRFSGTYRLGKVTHTINSSGYQTQFEIAHGHNLDLLGSLRHKLADIAGLDGQRIFGPMVGIVKVNNDPLHPGQVQVWLPELSDANLSAWATVATPMAGSGGQGMYFLPDIGDQVLVDFEDGDIDRPCVVSSLWGGKAQPPTTNQGQSERRMIQTRSGMKLVFDDTPGEEQLLIQDKDGGNTIRLRPKGDGEALEIRHPKGSTITMKSDGSIVVEAQGNLDFKATDKVSIKDGKKSAARKGDKVKSTMTEDAAFWRWLQGFIAVFISWVPAQPDGGTALKTALAAYLATNPAPSSLTSAIVEGSSNVVIGD